MATKGRPKDLVTEEIRTGRNVPSGNCFFQIARVIPELERGGAALSYSSQSSRIHPAALPAAGLAYEILIEGASSQLTQ